MSYKLLTIPPFEKQAKRLLKKYPFLKIELAELIGILKTNPLMGIPLGGDCFKFVWQLHPRKKESGGARIITYFAISENSIFLLSIYDKSERDNIEDSGLKRLLNFAR